MSVILGSFAIFHDIFLCHEINHTTKIQSFGISSFEKETKPSTKKTASDIRSENSKESLVTVI